MISSLADSLKVDEVQHATFKCVVGLSDLRGRALIARVYRDEDAPEWGGAHISLPLAAKGEARSLARLGNHKPEWQRRPDRLLRQLGVDVPE